MSVPMNILVRRRAEERTAKAASGVHDLLKVTGVVEFAHRSDRRIAGTLAAQRVSALRAAARAELDARRARLAALLEAVKGAFEREIAASFESPAAVKERLFAFARGIKEKREAARAALAAELEERRFRNASDLLRARASAIKTVEVALDRIAQLQVRRAARSARGPGRTDC